MSLNRDYALGGLFNDLRETKCFEMSESDF